MATEKRLVVRSISELRQEKERKDGKPSRWFYVLEVGDADDFFSKSRSINIWQQHITVNGEIQVAWRGGNYDVLQQMVAKYKAKGEDMTLPGEIIEVAVKPFVIPITKDGVTTDRTFNKVTIVRRGTESIATAVHNAGHLLPNEVKDENGQITIVDVPTATPATQVEKPEAEPANTLAS